MIRRAIEVNAPDPRDPLDVLSKVGGLDIAGMAGFYLGAALHHVPVVLDGAISAAAALLAVRLCPTRPRPSSPATGQRSPPAACSWTPWGCALLFRRT